MMVVSILRSTEQRNIMKTETIQIEGMACEKCREKVRKSIMSVDGSISADVSLEKKAAVVEYDPEKTDTEKIRESVRKAGFKA